MRNAENIAAHWPWPSWYDPYRFAPGGQLTDAPLMDIVIAGVAKITALPLDVVGAWTPAVAGALVPIPVFLLMRRVFGRAEAIVAALLTAILPGQLLQRSLLGHTDHHVLEALLAATVLLFLVRALDNRTPRDAAIAGVFLGLYLLTWSRGAFFVLILLAWAFLQVRSARPPYAITRIVVPLFGIALLIVVPVAVHLQTMVLSVAILAGGMLAVAAGEALMTRVARRDLAVGLLLMLIAGGVVAAAFAVPDLFTQALRFAPAGGAATVGEVQPLLFLGGRFSSGVLWRELTTASVLAVIGFAMLARASFAEGSAAKQLVLVWSVLTIGAAFAQGRFAYYMAVSAAMLAGIATIRLLWKDLDRIVAVLAIAAIVVYPNLTRVVNVAAEPNGGPTAAWLGALDWIRTHTPEPFGSPDAYFARYQSADDAPAAAFSVMVWWDYAWWVTAIARRPPATNPTQVAVKEAARFYLSTDEDEALGYLRQAKARYVIADRSMPMSTATAGRPMASQLEVMARWTEQREPSYFYELYYERGNPVFIFSAEYYKTMAIRLFAYGGSAYIPSNSTFAIITSGRNIIESLSFATHEEGEAFVKKDPRWRLVGRHPLLSPVPIVALQHFGRKYGSPEGVDGPIGRIPEVTIFRVEP